MKLGLREGARHVRPYFTHSCCIALFGKHSFLFGLQLLLAEGFWELKSTEVAFPTPVLPSKAPQEDSSILSGEHFLLMKCFM